MSKTTGFIYLIHAVGTKRFKIGFAIDPERRLRHLSTGSPFQLELLAVRKGPQHHEAQMHRYFAEYRVNGEWFEPRRSAEAFVEMFEQWQPIWTDWHDYEVTDEDRRRCTETMATIMRGRPIPPDVRI